MNHQRLISALREVLPLNDDELEQIISYAWGLDDAEAAQHLGNLLGDSPKSLEFIAFFLDARTTLSVDQNVAVGGSSSLVSPNLARDNSESKGPPQTIDGDRKGHKSDTGDLDSHIDQKSKSQLPPYAAISGSQAARRIDQYASAHHTNQFIEASKIRARDEVCKHSPKNAHRRDGGIPANNQI